MENHFVGPKNFRTTANTDFLYIYLLPSNVWLKSERYTLRCPTSAAAATGRAVLADKLAELHTWLIAPSLLT